MTTPTGQLCSDNSSLRREEKTNHTWFTWAVHQAQMFSLINNYLIIPFIEYWQQFTPGLTHGTSKGNLVGSWERFLMTENGVNDEITL